MTKVAVTGGAGFIGSNLVKKLVKKGHEVTVIDDFSTGIKSNLDFVSSRVIQTSILDFTKLKSCLSDCDTIFHLAARGSVPRSIKNPILTNEVNVLGTLNVLEIARETGAHVIFTSSSSVYGRNNELPKREQMWTSPLSPYAASKLAGESYLQSYYSAFSVPVTILRLFNVFGPFQRPDHKYSAVVPKWIWQALNNKPITINGDGTVTRDFTFVDSVTEIAYLSMSNKTIHELPINLAFGNCVSLNQIVEHLSNRFINLKVQYSTSREGDIKNSKNSPELLNSLFPKFSPIPFFKALDKTIDWFVINKSMIEENLIDLPEVE